MESGPNVFDTNYDLPYLEAHARPDFQALYEILLDSFSKAAKAFSQSSENQRVYAAIVSTHWETAEIALVFNTEEQDSEKDNKDRETLGLCSSRFSPSDSNKCTFEPGKPFCRWVSQYQLYIRHIGDSLDEPEDDEALQRIEDEFHQTIWQAIKDLEVQWEQLQKTKDFIAFQNESSRALDRERVEKTVPLAQLYKALPSLEVEDQCAAEQANFLESFALWPESDQESLLGEALDRLINGKVTEHPSKGVEFIALPEVFALAAKKLGQRGLGIFAQRGEQSLRKLMECDRGSAEQACEEFKMHRREFSNCINLIKHLGQDECLEEKYVGWLGLLNNHKNRECWEIFESLHLLGTYLANLYTPDSLETLKYPYPELHKRTWEFKNLHQYQTPYYLWKKKCGEIS